ncbi:hypothetical protein [Caballeronia sordidicola]|uniref:hypothetical protein n=1 Tax=Caballeronia sordidicola TaxID=196367 RepID=UPI0004D035B2|nr:hypothetical protein [Caballeronia sordidicola]
MQKFTFEECIAGAWRDGWNLARQRPLFVVTSIAAIFFIRIAQDELRAIPVPHSISVMLAMGALWLISVLLMNAIVVQAVRYVLLGDEATTFSAFAGRNYWRYCGLAYGLLASIIIATIVGMTFIVIALHLLGIHGHERALYSTSGFVIVIVAVWVNVRLSLLPSHVAIGKPLSWRAAWRDTRGRCMTIVGTHLGIVVTLCGGAILVEGIAGLIAFAINDGRHGPVMELALVIILVPGLIVSGAGSGWIYRRYAVELVAQRQGT